MVLMIILYWWTEMMSGLNNRLAIPIHREWFVNFGTLSQGYRECLMILYPAQSVWLWLAVLPIAYFCPTPRQWLPSVAESNPLYCASISTSRPIVPPIPISQSSVWAESSTRWRRKHQTLQTKSLLLIRTSRFLNMSILATICFMLAAWL